MLVPEISFGTRQGSFSSSFASRGVSHDGETQGNDGKREKIVQQEKQKVRPELKVVICKDGRSSARVSPINSFSPPPTHTCGPFPQMLWNMQQEKTQNNLAFFSCVASLPSLLVRNPAQ